MRCVLSPVMSLLCACLLMPSAARLAEGWSEPEGSPAPGKVVPAAAESGESWVYPPEIAAWDEAEKNRQRMNAADLMEQIRHAIEQGKTEFQIPQDDYRFGSKELPQFKLENVKDFTIDGNGSTFWINGRIRYDGIKLVRCENVTLRNLFVDCDPFSYIQTTIREVDFAAQSLLVEIDPGFPLPDSTWNKRVGDIKAVFLKPDGSFHAQRLDWIREIAPVAGHSFRVTVRDNSIFTYETPVQPGDTLLLPDRGMRNAVDLQVTSGSTIENVTVYAAPAMGIVEVGGDGGNTYRGCRVVPRPGTRRRLACNADTFHSIVVGKGPLIENCEFSHACDDFVNIHGFFGMVVRQTAPDEIVMAMPYGARELERLSIEFFDIATERRAGEAVVEKSAVFDDAALRAEAMAMPQAIKQEIPHAHVRDFPGTLPLYRLKLDRPVEAKKYTLVDQYAYSGGGAVLRNNYFHHGTARGILLKGENSVIENNRIEQVGHAGILVASDLYFFENACPRNVVIRNNRVADCNLFLSGQLWFNGQHAAISVYFEGRQQAFSRQTTDACRDVRILGNTVERPSGTGIFMANTSGGAIEDNRIIGACPSEPHPKTTPERNAASYAVYLSHSERISVKNNVNVQPGTWCKGIIGSGDQLIDCTEENNRMEAGVAE